MTYGVAPSRRLPEATRLGAVTLLVSDLERSLAFYQDTIGFAVIARTAGAAALAPPGASQPLLHLHAGASVQGARRVERLGLYHFAILLPNRASLGRCLNHLAESRVAVSSADHAVSEALYLWDPDGLGIEIYVDRPRETWRMHEQELFMTSEPLDLRGLSAAAEGMAWSGLPHGTVLGHMHLHVGDLAQAEAFYHTALGFDKTVWSYPGALFLAAGGYHHHLGTNTWAGGVPSRAANEPGLLEWEIVVPSVDDARAAAESCRRAGYAVDADGDGWKLRDPWGTTVRILH
jgi:catechol 2,3-dioxygenase